jgi:hypothetical protein
MKLKKGQRSWKMWAILSSRGSLLSLCRTKAEAKAYSHPNSVIKKVIVLEDE